MTIGDPRTADAHPKRATLPDATTLVILDDFVGAGTEAFNYLALCRPQLDRYERVVFMSILGFEEGLVRIAAEYPEVTVKTHTVCQKGFAESTATRARSHVDRLPRS